MVTPLILDVTEAAIGGGPTPRPPLDGGLPVYGGVLTSERLAGTVSKSTY